jgi:hypothetical protein
LPSVAPAYRSVLDCLTAPAGPECTPEGTSLLLAGLLFPSSASSSVTCNRLAMHRFSRSFLSLGVLAWLGCGAPADLDDTRFPRPNETGYVDGVGATGNGGRANLGGGSSVSTGGAAGSRPQGGGAPSTGGGGSVAAGGGASTGGCPDDITLLFNRPAMQGGCASSGCHVPGGIVPDLVSPNVEMRLVNVSASQSCKARPYVSAGDSVLADKLEKGTPAPCGFKMPLGAAISDADLACVMDWIAEVSGG